MDTVFSIEDISDDSTVYRRIHRNHIRDNKIIPGAFPTEDDGLSVNWNKYSTPDSTKSEVALYGKNPEDYGVVSFDVKYLRSITLDVIHNPSGNYNRAHSLVVNIPPFKPNGLGTRLKLIDNCTWQIKI